MKSWINRFILLIAVAGSAYAQQSEVICTIEESCNLESMPPQISSALKCPSGHFYHSNQPGMPNPTSVPVVVIDSNGTRRSVRLQNAENVELMELVERIHFAASGSVSSLSPAYTSQLGLRYGDRIVLDSRSGFGFSPTQRLSRMDPENLTGNYGCPQRPDTAPTPIGEGRVVNTGPSPAPTNQPSSCRYSELPILAQNNSGPCGYKICYGRALCNLEGVEVEGNVFCPALANGECPDASACALSEEIKISQALPPSSRSGGAVRASRATEQ